MSIPPLDSFNVTETTEIPGSPWIPCGPRAAFPVSSSLTNQLPLAPIVMTGVAPSTPLVTLIVELVPSE